MAELVAVVDLGSTAVRFLIAKIVPNSGYRVLVEERVPTRLGSGRPGILRREAIDESLKAVHKFFARYSRDSWGPRVVAVATSAVRETRRASVFTRHWTACPSGTAWWRTWAARASSCAGCAIVRLCPWRACRW